VSSTVVFGALGCESNGRVDDISFRSSRPPLFVEVKGNTPPKMFMFRGFPEVSLFPLDFEFGRGFDGGGAVFSLLLFGL
jgi:hypothetical protein